MKFRKSISELVWLAWWAGTGVAFPQYVDSKVCGSCHGEIAETYRRTGMGRSFYRPSAGAGGEQGEYYHALSDTHFLMERRGEEFFQKRWQVGLRGEPINVEELRVDYVMGSGNHARSYLSRTAAGTLIELPLGWYPKTGSDAGGLGMSPGSDTEQPLTRRFISYKCMFCHNAVPEIPEGNKGPGSDPVFRGSLPAGIDCQRCHGPGGAHVRLVAGGGAKASEIRAGIVNPARLSPERAMEVCMQCHLETTSTRIPATVVRFDRGPFSFRPGEALKDFLLSFDHEPGTGHEDKFETVSSVYRFRQSKCFTESAGKLTCQTCHDPHKVPRGEEAVRVYSKVCSGCHSGQALSVVPGHPAGGDCVTCHMPKRRADDIPRMTMTDHFIRRKPALELVDLPAPSPALYRGEVTQYYPAAAGGHGEDELYRAAAQVGLGNNLEAGLPLLQRELASRKPREPEFYFVLGDALRASGKGGAAALAYRQGLQLQPNSVRGLRSLGTEVSLKKAVALAPGDSESWFRYGLLDAEAGRLRPAVERIRKAIGLDPAMPGRSRRLGEILLQSGDVAGAAKAVEDELRADPYDNAAWDLAGRLHSQKGEMAEAEFAFGKAVRGSSPAATHLYDFALALARAGRFGDAEMRVLRALQTDPKMASAHELLGGLFEQKKQAGQAIAEYRRALELKPEGRVHLRLGNLLVAGGDRAGAMAEFREAAKSADAAIAAQAREALR